MTSRVRRLFVAAPFLALAVAFVAPLSAQEAAPTREWLAKNTSAADFPARLLAAVKAEADPYACRALIADFARFVKPGPVLRELMTLEASLAELTGAWREAAAAWERAAYADPAVREAGALLNATRCYLAAGDAQAAKAVGRPALLLATTDEERWLADVLLAWADALSGESDAAIERAKVLAVGAKGRARVLALWLLALSGNEKESSAAIASLSALGEASPDRALAKGSMALAASPLWYFGFGGLAVVSGDAARAVTTSAATTPAGTTPAGTTPAATTASSSSSTTVSTSAASDAPTFFQVGAFGSKANADKLVSRLKDKGIVAIIREKTGANGTVVYVVLVIVKGSDPEALKMTLKDMGLEAFSVWE